MTYRDNVKAILEANFIGFNEEYLDAVCKKICGIKTEKAYDDGLNDAWECARKVMLVSCDGGLSLGEHTEIFGSKFPAEILNNLTASEAIAKIKEYEEKQKCQKRNGNCSVLNDICSYDIPCAECEVHCSVERAKQKLKGDKDA